MVCIYCSHVEDQELIHTPLNCQYAQIFLTVLMYVYLFIRLFYDIGYCDTFCIEDKKNGALINNYKLSFKTHLNHKLEVYYGFHQDKFYKILKKFFKLKR